MKMEEISVSAVITRAASTTTRETIYIVPGGQKLRVTKLIVHFPSGSNFELEIALYRGEFQAVPRSGTIRGDDAVIEVTSKYDFDSDSNVRIYGKNNSATTTHQALVTVEGILYSEGELT